MMEATDDIIEVTDASFARDVLEESASRPVVIDFWAAWCAPCRALSPVLEKLAVEANGAFRLAKIDVDRNVLAPAQFGVQGIPAVKAIVDGRLAAEFTGAYPEEFVREWLRQFVPAPRDEVLEHGRTAEGEGDLAAAEAAYREVLAADEQNRDARLALGRVLAERGVADEAREVLAPILPDDEAERVLAQLRVSAWRDDEGEDELSAARRLAAAGRYEEALEAMVRTLSSQPDATREAMLDVFRVLGDDDPLTRRFRSKLAAALF